jgi:hypothetical protein
VVHHLRGLLKRDDVLYPRVGTHIGRAGQVRMVPYATAGEAHEALAAQRRMKERRGYSGIAV